MKKIVLSLALVAMMSVVSCKDSKTETTEETTTETTTEAAPVEETAPAATTDSATVKTDSTTVKTETTTPAAH